MFQDYSEASAMLLFEWEDPAPGLSAPVTSWDPYTLTYFTRMGVPGPRMKRTIGRDIGSRVVLNYTDS